MAGSGGGEWASAEEVLVISDRIREALVCPVCLDLCADVTCDCPNGHAVCATCRARLWTTDGTRTCPLCRSPASTATGGSVTARRLLMALPLVNVACRYRQNGCAVLMRVPDAARHEAVCEYCPDVRCLAASCPWLGAYDRLYGHVRDRHPEAVVCTQDDRLTVTDADRIMCKTRRVYLVTADRGRTLMWVLVCRETRTQLQAAVFAAVPRRSRLTDMGYRLTYADAVGRCNARSQTRWVGKWPCCSAAADGRRDAEAAESYTTFRPRTGRVVVHWFEHSTGRCARAPDDSRVRVMDAPRP